MFCSWNVVHSDAINPTTTNAVNVQLMCSWYIPMLIRSKNTTTIAVVLQLKYCTFYWHKFNDFTCSYRAVIVQLLLTSKQLQFSFWLTSKIFLQLKNAAVVLQLLNCNSSLDRTKGQLQNNFKTAANVQYFNCKITARFLWECTWMILLVPKR